MAPTEPTPAAATKPKSSAAGLGWLILIGIIVWWFFLRGPSTPSGISTPDAGATARPAAAAAVLLDLKGNGIKKSTPFTATGPWTLAYTFDCASFGTTGNFIVTVYGTDGGLKDVAVNELAGRGSSSTQGYVTGQLYLEMNSECSWGVRVTG